MKGKEVVKMTIQERTEAMKLRMAKLQRRGAVTKKVSKEEIFNHVVELCPSCKGEQFVPVWLEDGSKKEKFCPTCFGSGINPKEDCFKRAYVWGK
jgi:RNA polymerase subunit RPABC4/transcription elongation factor Spt4